MARAKETSIESGQMHHAEHERCCRYEGPSTAVHFGRRQVLMGLASCSVAVVAAGQAHAIGPFDAPFAVPGAGSFLHIAQMTAPLEPAPTLLTAPIELAGDWGRMLPHAAARVVERMRHACLDGVALCSDRQPTRVRVDRHASGLPAIWLHRDGSSVAWIIVDIGERDWSKLAYQFGHELGHVMANSWQPHARPGPPCQWIEEALVEAFALHGLGRLAESWKRDPPFRGDNAFGNAVAAYRDTILQRYSAQAATQDGVENLAAWFIRNRSGIEKSGLVPFAQTASLKFLAEFERTPSCVEALGALNRWPGRTGLRIEDYLRQWEASCIELGASAALPNRVKDVLGIATSPACDEQR